MTTNKELKSRLFLSLVLQSCSLNQNCSADQSVRPGLMGVRSQVRSVVHTSHVFLLFNTTAFELFTLAAPCVSIRGHYYILINFNHFETGLTPNLPPKF